MHTHTHTCVCREQQWLTHTHTHNHIVLWLEPAALTQQYINHWALSSTAGPQCHAELDSTGIKVCNWIQKLIQARRQLLALEVLIPPCDETPSLSWDLLTPALRLHRPTRCYWSGIRETGVGGGGMDEWGHEGKRVRKTRPVKRSSFWVLPSVSTNVPFLSVRQV